VAKWAEADKANKESAKTLLSNWAAKNVAELDQIWTTLQDRYPAEAKSKGRPTDAQLRAAAAKLAVLPVPQ
jgi:hypothetical protein